MQILFLILFILIIFFLFYSSSKNKKKDRAIEKYSEDFFMQLEKKENRKLKYNYKGRQIDLDIKKTLVNADTNYYVIVFTLLMEIDPSLKGNITLVSTSLNNFNNSDILTGDKKFDRYFYLSCFFTPFASGILTEDLRNEIIKIRNWISRIDIESNIIKFEIRKENSMSHNTFNELFSSLSEIANIIEEFSSLDDAIEYNINNDSKYGVKLNCIKRSALLSVSKERIFEIVKDSISNNNLILSLAACETAGKPAFPFLDSYIRDILKYEKSIQEEIIRISVKNDYPFKIDAAKKLYTSTKSTEIKKHLVRFFEKDLNDDILTFLINDFKIIKDYRLLKKVLKLCEKHGKREHIVLLRNVFNIDSKFAGLYKPIVERSINMIQYRLGPVEKGWISVDDSDPLNGALSSNFSEKGKLSIKSTKGVNK